MENLAANHDMMIHHPINLSDEVHFNNLQDMMAEMVDGRWKIIDYGLQDMMVVMKKGAPYYVGGKQDGVVFTDLAMGARPTQVCTKSIPMHCHAIRLI